MASALEICRICLGTNVKMYTLKKTNIQNLYKLLTQVYLDTEDGKPATVCFLCYARLRQCERLQQQAIKSNELLEQLLKGGFMHATANAILSSQYTSQNLQVSSVYHLDFEPATCEYVFSVPIVEADSLISIKKEVEEAKDKGHNVTDLEPMTCDDVFLYPKVEATSLISVKEENKAIDEGNNLTDLEPMTCEDVFSYPKVEANSLISVKEENEAIDEGNNVTDFPEDTNDSNDLDPEDNHLLIAICSKNSDQIKDIAYGMKRIKQYEGEKLCIIQPEKEVKNYSHIFNSTQIQQKGKPYNTNEEAKGINMKSERNLEKKKSTEQTLKKLINNDVNAGVNMKRKRKLEKVLPNKQKNPKPHRNEDTQKIYINDLKTSVINTIIYEFQCKECGKQFSAKDILTDHILKCKKNGETSVSNTQLEMYRCDICTFKTYNKLSIDNHFKMHSSTKVLSCNICEYRCAHKSRLKLHMKKHTGEKPFSCNICVYKCATVYNLKKHIKKHTGEKPFSCNICEYRCAQNTDLKRHMRKHTGEEPFSCNICEYKCLHRTNLKQHMRTHTGEKPFSCNICEYRCAKSTDLKRHMRTHKGE